MKRILVVDDSEFMRSKIKLILEKESCDVFEAEDGYDAIKMYKDIQPDIVTMDINMPGKSGLETIKEILILDADAKIVVITSMGAERMIRDSIQYGASNFIMKPFDDEQIIEVRKLV